jgi:hypothetical protein
MTKLIVGALVLVAMTGSALVQPAEAAKARCEWDGQNRVCLDEAGHLHRDMQQKMLVGVRHGGK